MTSPRLYTDEDVDGRLAAALVAIGFDAVSCPEAGNAGFGHSDQWQLEYAVQHQRTILTHNVGDYSNLASQWAIAGRSHYGIVFAHQMGLSALIARVVMFMTIHSAKELEDGTFWLP